MRATLSALRTGSGTEVRRAGAGPARRIPVIALAIGGAWLIAIVAQATGQAGLLHHHALIENGPPLWLAVPLFLVGWEVMIGAMMLPASLPTIRLVSTAMDRLSGPRRAQFAFLAGFAVVWTAFGLLAFLGDLVVHRIVDATPSLAARPWLIEAGVVGLAGAYQFSRLKRRSLADCRHPAALAAIIAPAARGPLRVGLDHGVACLGSSGALMLLMFAEGFASLAWMAALTAIMVYEATGRHGQRAARAVGVVLLAFGAVILANG